MIDITAFAGIDYVCDDVVVTSRRRTIAASVAAASAAAAAAVKRSFDNDDAKSTALNQCGTSALSCIHPTNHCRVRRCAGRHLPRNPGTDQADLDSTDQTSCEIKNELCKLFLPTMCYKIIVIYVIYVICWFILYSTCWLPYAGESCKTIIKPTLLRSVTVISFQTV